MEHPAKRVRLLDVELERWLGSYKPDIYARDEAGELLIEIRVTHAVDDRKAETVKARGQRMVEIDLSTLDRSIPHDTDAFERAVLFDIANRTWISCPQAIQDWQTSKEELDRQIAERNGWLAEQREMAVQAQRKSQEGGAKEAKDKASRREYVRQIERAKHASDLVQLRELTQPSRILLALHEYQKDAETRVSDLLGAAIPSVRAVCLSCHPDAWIFGVDPVLWQLLAYDHFVGKRMPGTRFNQRDAATWVRKSFPYDRPLYRLFVTQYAKRAEARRAGFEKRRLAYWAFTDEENARIPDFYAPINAFMDRLAGAHLVRQLPTPIGEFEVLPSPSFRFNPAAVVDARHRRYRNSPA